ncbi:cell envelope integrity protein TolA [Massilia sp. Root351]|jgi:colicin import membrane protein|uniref:cell envelope integrity protein TolA n=1 Tax=Massilia sp. Root351 TaxID=1736522 RepID=UPI000A8A3B81|nr:cell envelope integrity protein TolA [Massilia sp. Root351]
MTMKHATAGGPYRVPKRDDRWSSIGLAAAMHAGLLFFLWVGVAWQNTEPVAVEAEVWDMTTQTAAPPAPTPPQVKPEPEPEPEPTPAPPPKVVAPPVEAPPPAVDPDIALQKRKAKEKAEKERVEEEKAKKILEQKKLEDQRKLDEKKKLEEKREAEEKAKEDKAREEKKAAEKAAKAKAEAEQKKLEKQRAADMARIMGTAGAGTTGTAAKATAPRLDSGYVAAITAKIKSNIAYGGGDTAGNPRAEFKIEQLPTGEIISVRKIKSSGIPAYDLAVEAAIAKSSPLPKKKDGSVEREITAGFNMKDLP